MKRKTSLLNPGEAQIVGNIVKLSLEKNRTENRRGGQRGRRVESEKVLRLRRGQCARNFICRIALVGRGIHHRPPSQKRLDKNTEIARRADARAWEDSRASTQRGARAPGRASKKQRR